MTKSIILALLFTGAGIATLAQKPESFAKTITPADLKRDLFILAGPEMEGRETATPGQQKAASFIENRFRAIGLQPGAGAGFQMNYPVYQDSLLSASMVINGKEYVVDLDFNPVIANNNDATQRFSEVTWLAANAPGDSIRNMNLAGKLVMLRAAVPQGRGGMSGLLPLLISKGVSAILLVQPNYPRTASARKSNTTLNLYRRSQPPQQYGVSPAIFSALTNNDTAGRTSLVIPADITLQTRKTTLMLQSSNVVGLLPGSDLKDQYLFITAHYDHLGKRGDSVIFYGADDDGSGTVGIIEIAEAFAKAKAAGKGPRRSIVFMAVSGEEKGLWGSDYYSSHPLFPLDKTTADLNIDMIGRSDTERKGDTTNYVYVVGDDKLSSDLRTISVAANNKYTKLQLDYKFNDPQDPNRIYFRSDHYNFAKKGVPIIFYYDGMLKGDYHRPTDTPDKINYSLLAKRAQLVFYTAWEMANREAMLKRDIPLDAGSLTR